MSISKFKDDLRDPSLRLAWKLGRAHTKVDELFAPDNRSARTLYRKVPFNNAFLYSLEKNPKREILIFLLGMPAFEDMEPARIAETFGEPVAALVAEMKTLDGDEDVKDASKLAQEAAAAAYGFLERQLDNANETLADLNKSTQEMIISVDELNARVTHMEKLFRDTRASLEDSMNAAFTAYQLPPGAKPN